jgi:hypothetical protein
MLYFAIWYVLGILGNYILFKADKMSDYPMFKGDLFLCPTPLRLIMISLTSFFGVAMILVGFVILMIEVSDTTKIGNDFVKWMQTPICGK